jgi:hypothetical protein
MFIEKKKNAVSELNKIHRINGIVYNYDGMMVWVYVHDGF